MYDFANNNLLKINWERRHDPFHVDVKTAKNLIADYSDAKIVDISLLSNGCANTNYKIVLDNDEIYVLRIYIRDSDAFYREAALHKLLKGKAPIPNIHYTDDTCDKIPYSFAIMGFADGFLMRDIILQGNLKDIGDCTFSAGICLNKLREIPFSQSGFFNKNIDVSPFSKQEAYLSFTQSCLESHTVQSTIGKELTSLLISFIQDNAHYFPEQYAANLTHADFDPSNILVKKINSCYEVSAILDWEFAFSGTYLFDIGLFLRYSHRLPETYEQKFIEGIITKNNPLPPDWKKSSKLLDILSLVSILDSKSIINRPSLTQDITELFKHTIKTWAKF